MALTPEEQKLVDALYEKIRNGEANSTPYDDNSPFPTPTTEAEQQRYTIPMIKDVGTDDEMAGNINARELLKGFGAELLSENTIAAQNIAAMNALKTAYDENAIAKTADFNQNVTQMTTAAEQAISGYVEQTSKPALDSYVTNTAKPAIDEYVEDTAIPAVQAVMAQVTLVESDYEAL